MNTPIRKNITIALNVNNNGSFNFTIDHVNFIPDEVIVRCINYATNVALENGILSQISSDLVPDTQIIGSFFANSTIRPNTAFTLGKPIRGTYQIRLLDITNLPEDARVGQLVIHLEFIKNV